MYAIRLLHRFFSIAIFIVFTLTCNALNSILDNLKEAPVNGGFEMEDYWVWGSSVIKWDNGKTIKQGQLERVFVLVENDKPSHLFFATMDGPGGFGNSTKSWNMVIPLK